MFSLTSVPRSALRASGLETRVPETGSFILNVSGSAINVLKLRTASWAPVFNQSFRRVLAGNLADASVW